MNCPKCGSFDAESCQAAYASGTATAWNGQAEVTVQTPFARKASPPSHPLAVFLGMWLLLGVFLVINTLIRGDGSNVVSQGHYRYLFGGMVALVGLWVIANQFRRTKWRASKICRRCTKVWFVPGDYRSEPVRGVIYSLLGAGVIGLGVWTLFQPEMLWCATVVVPVVAFIKLCEMAGVNSGVAALITYCALPGLIGVAIALIRRADRS